MGHRANLIVVDEKEYHLYYCHWCANTIPRDVFWGSEWALAFIASQKEVPKDERGWLDDVWAEGGVLVDLQAKHLLLWGGEDLKFGIPDRRFYLGLLAQTWQGWKVQWAMNGIFDFADYLHIDRAMVTSKSRGEQIETTPTLEEQIAEIRFLPPENLDWISVVGSIHEPDGKWRFLPIDSYGEFLDFGTLIIEAARQSSFIFDQALDVSKLTSTFPHTGFHVDVSRQQLFLWSHETPDIERIHKAWEGWEIIWLGEEYETHLALTEGRLTFPIPDYIVLLESLTHYLLSEQRTIGLDAIRNISIHYAKEGISVEMNPSALIESPQQTPDELRRAILERAIASWRAKQV